MTEQEYNQAEGIRRSDLWKMEDSPEKFRYFSEHPVEQTPAMAFGSACHKFILEPADFGNEYAVAPQVDRRTKEGKAAWDEFAKNTEGLTIISLDDAQTIWAMEEALGKCPLARKLIRGKGETEKPFFWTDAETGEKCKIKVDRLVTWNRRKYVVDYKTTQSAETGRFNVDMWKLGYYMQAAMYTEGVMRAKRMRKRPGFLFVAQEKKAPYSVNVIEVSEEVMKIGTAKFHELLEKYHECKTVDLWPGYVDDVPNETTIPGWYSLDGEE